MKKIIIAIIIFVVVMAFTMPIFADKPENPGYIGQQMKWFATRGFVGGHFSGIAVNGEPGAVAAFHQGMKVNAGLPAKHIP